MYPGHGSGDSPPDLRLRGGAFEESHQEEVPIVLKPPALDGSQTGVILVDTRVEVTNDDENLRGCWCVQILQK